MSDLGAHADAPTPPILAQNRLAVGLQDGRQALAELPAILSSMPCPAGAAQECRHGLPRPRLGARDLEAGHDEMPDDGGRTLGAATAAQAFGFAMTGVVPQSISRAKDEKLKALGAELVKIAGGPAMPARSAVIASANCCC